jgi:L-cysteine S-thiosulfotransferase
MSKQQTAKKQIYFASRAALIGCTFFASILFGTKASAEFVIKDDRIEVPLTQVPGDALRGRAIVTNRQLGLCLLCHTGQFKEELTPGNVAPTFEGIGARYSTAQLRLRVAKIRHLYPQSIMPNMHELAEPAAEQRRVASRFNNQPILTAEQVEDVVAFLKSLQ